MPNSSTVDIVKALRAYDIIDLFGHQLGQHPEPDTDRQRQQPFLRRSGELAERFLHALGQRIELALADRVGVVVYGPHGGSPRLLDLFALATVPAGPDEARRTATFKFYELRDNLKHVVKMVKPGARPITLPTHGGKDYSVGLTRAILRQAGIDPEEL